MSKFTKIKDFNLHVDEAHRVSTKTQIQLLVFQEKKNPLDIKKLHNFSFAFWTVMCYTRKKQETLKKTKKRARDVISDKTNFQA